MSAMRNQLPSHQTPKNERREIKRGGCSEYYLTDPRYNYTPYSDCATTDVVKRRAYFDGSGEADERVAWRCPDCGAPATGPDQAACGRCGSVEEPVWR